MARQTVALVMLNAGTVALAFVIGANLFEQFTCAPGWQSSGGIGELHRATGLSPIRRRSGHAQSGLTRLDCSLSTEPPTACVSSFLSLASFLASVHYAADWL
jgi:hypothetical protein